jgi:hypothetical protein
VVVLQTTGIIIPMETFKPNNLVRTPVHLSLKVVQVGINRILIQKEIVLHSVEPYHIIASDVAPQIFHLKSLESSLCLLLHPEFLFFHQTLLSG